MKLMHFDHVMQNNDPQDQSFIFQIENKSNKYAHGQYRSQYPNERLAQLYIKQNAMPISKVAILCWKFMFTRNEMVIVIRCNKILSKAIFSNAHWLATLPLTMFVCFNSFPQSQHASPICFGEWLKMNARASVCKVSNFYSLALEYESVRASVFHIETLSLQFHSYTDAISAS